jgi:hypothetical protein
MKAFMKKLFLLALALLSIMSHASQHDPVELVDYIFDRYEYLGLGPDASKEQIEAEIKNRKSQNHPDRLTKVSADLQSQARLNWSRIEDCERILLDDELRPLFDQRLSDFKTNRPRLVSAEGHVLVDLEGNFVDLALLTGSTDVDASEMIKRIELFSNYKPKEFERSKKLWKDSPEDSDFIEMYRSALEKKIFFLELVEKIYWAKAGIRGKGFTSSAKPSFDPTAFPEAVANQIEHVKSKIIPVFARERTELVALGYDKNPALLLTAGKSISAEKSQSLATELASTVEVAQSRFVKLSEEIIKNAEEKSEAMANLLELSPFEIIHSVDSSKVTIYLLNDKSEENSLEKGKVVAIAHFADGKFELEMPSEGMSIADLRKRSFESTVAAVVLNRSLAKLTLDIGAAYKRVMLTFGEQIDLN